MRGLSALVLRRPIILTARHARLPTPKQYSAKGPESFSRDDFLKTLTDAVPEDKAPEDNVSTTEVLPEVHVLQPGLAQQETTQHFSTQPGKNELRELAKIAKIKKKEDAAVRKLNVEFTEAWWQRQDLTAGPGWVNLLPPTERAIALAMRKHLDRWPAYVATTTTPSLANYEATVQLLRLRNEYARLRVRFKAGDMIRHHIQTSYQQLHSAFKTLEGLIRFSLSQLALWDELEMKHGRDWVAGYQQWKQMQWIRRKSSREQEKIWSSIRVSAILAHTTERMLTQLRWYDVLEREHGADWERIAKANVAQWTRDWDKARLPVDVEFRIHQRLRHTDVLRQICEDVLRDVTSFRSEGGA